MKRVAKYDLDNNLLKVYDTIKECSIDNDIPTSIISRCCSSKYKGCRSRNFLFKYYTQEEISNKEKIKKAKNQTKRIKEELEALHQKFVKEYINILEREN